MPQPGLAVEPKGRGGQFVTSSQRHVRFEIGTHGPSTKLLAPSFFPFSLLVRQRHLRAGTFSLNLRLPPFPLLLRLARVCKCLVVANRFTKPRTR